MKVAKQEKFTVLPSDGLVSISTLAKEFKLNPQFLRMRFERAGVPMVFLSNKNRSVLVNLKDLPRL